MWQKWDVTELEYLRMERLRGLPALNEAQKARLQAHEALEKRIMEEPKEVMKEAYEALDKGTSLLCKLIRSKRLYKRLVWPNGMVHESDDAVSCLYSRLHHFNSQLLRLAEERKPHACGHLFFEAHRFARTFIRLAQAFPEEFQSSAETSLTMPSLRSANPEDTADAEAIAKAIRLGASHPASTPTAQRERLGALCHELVVEILTRIHRAREEHTRERSTAKNLNVEVREVIESTYYPTMAAHVLACAELPDWSEDPQSWWKWRVLPMVKERFEALARDPLRHPALWQELQRRGETRQTTLNDMRRTLEKNCRNKFLQFARAAHSEAAHGQPG